MEPKLTADEAEPDPIIADLVVVVEIPAWENNDMDHLFASTASTSCLIRRLSSMYKPDSSPSQ